MYQLVVKVYIQLKGENPVETLYAILKALGVLVTALQAVSHVLPFVPSLVVQILAGLAVLIDDLPTIIGKFTAKPAA